MLFLGVCVLEENNVLVSRLKEEGPPLPVWKHHPVSQKPE